MPSGPYFLIRIATLSDGFAPTLSQYFSRSPLIVVRASVSAIVRIVSAEFLDHAAVAGAAEIGRADPEK